MTLSEYSYLKKLVISSVGYSDRHDDLLAELKNMFSKEINSPRRIEKIKNVSQLLEMLELREALSEDNVGPLRVIASMPLLLNRELLGKLAKYEKCHIPRDYRNYYAQERIQPIIQGPLPNVTSIPCGQMSPMKKQRIIDTVKYEIGKTWIDLARCLRISEGYINDIDHKYTSLPSKASIMLDLYFCSKADDKWFFELCKALEKSRRRDLVKEITKICTSNI